MKITAEPRSDQINADDLIGGSKTYTIEEVTPGKAEQKYDIKLVGETRVWRPPLTMLRVLIALWGDRAADWKGRRVTLYRDPKVRFGPNEVGGIRISHASHITQTTKVPVTLSRAKRGLVTIDPLPDTMPADADTVTDDVEISDDRIQAETDIGALRAMWQAASPEQKALIEQRVKNIETGDSK